MGFSTCLVRSRNPESCFSSTYLRYYISARMRPLTEEETKTMFDKLAKYIGAENIKLLVDRSDGTYCFRLHRERVYYVSEKIMKQAKRCKRKPDLTGDVFWQVHQNSQVPTSHHLLGLPSALRQLQALAQSLSRAAVPLRAQRHKVWVGQNNREHRQVPGSCCLLDAGPAPGIRCCRQIYHRVQTC